MADTSERLSKLATRLLERTEAGAVEWQETDEERSFLYVGASASVTIRRQRNGDLVLAVLNENGTVIDSIADDWYDDDVEAMMAAPWADTLGRLHEAARRNALDIDSVVDNLMSELEGGDPSPPPYGSTRAPNPDEDPFGYGSGKEPF